MLKSFSWWILVLLLLLETTVATTDPYQILGVARDSSSKEIQKIYRQLCLKYHPDKNGHKSSKERNKCEEKFKTVQKAYSLIGDEQSRNDYDVQSAFGAQTRRSSSPNNNYHSASSPLGRDPVAEAFFRAFQQAGGVRKSFYFGPRFNVQRPFPTSSSNNFMPANLSFKSIYVQKVAVPLEQLYKGVDWKFTLVDNMWTRWRAAIRGKIAYLSFYQALMYSLPVLRTSKFLAFVVSLVVANTTLPKPDPRQAYESHLRRGSKGGKTKVKFASTQFGKPEVIFEITEAPHDIYTRVGNDLHTDLVISSREAKEGCMKTIPSLVEDELIRITLQPNQVQTSGDTVRIAGKGWPIRNAPDVYLQGDIVVRVIIKQQRRKKKKNASP